MSKKDKKTIFSNSLADYSAALRQHPASPVYGQMPLALSQKYTLISQNWNLLSLNMLSWLTGEKVVEEF